MYLPGEWWSEVGERGEDLQDLGMQKGLGFPLSLSLSISKFSLAGWFVLS
jgi:hypothetical protein